MTRNGRMQKVMTRVLSVMLMASLVLALVSFMLPEPVSASYCWCEKYFCYNSVFTCKWRCCDMNNPPNCWWGDICYNDLRPCYHDDCPQP